jgi:hypothetical protein
LAADGLRLRAALRRRRAGKQENRQHGRGERGFSHCPFQHNARYNEGSIPSFAGDFPLADEKLYKAEYLGSGTFIISKPKRKKSKARQSQLKNPQRGSRK